MARHLGREKWQGADFTLVGDPTLDDTLLGKNDKGHFELVSKIVITSTRDSANPNTLFGSVFGAEIYLINPDGNPQRLTNNSYGDGGGWLSPDGKKMLFESNQFRADPADPSTWFLTDLFVMDADGSNRDPADARKLRHLVAGRQGHHFPRLGFVLRHWRSADRGSDQGRPGRGRHGQRPLRGERRRTRLRPRRSDQNPASDQHHQHP